MRPASPTGLYWSVNGEVACEAHAPESDDQRWDDEGWQPIPASAGRFRGPRYQCQHCVASGRSVVHLDEPKFH
jgi:hypothetical protein